MRIELEVAGVDVGFLSINKSDAVEQQPKLVEQCSFPLLQDLEEVGVWDLMAGHKDDFYIYDAAGELARYLPVSGGISMNLSTDQGYANLKQQILEVAGVVDPVGCVTAEPTKVQIGGVAVSLTKTRSVTLTSSCAAPVTITAIELETGEDGACVGQGCSAFAVEPAAPLPVTLAPGETLELEVHYSPTQEAPRDEEGQPVIDAATVVVASDGIPLTVPVTGLGIAQPCAAPSVTMTVGGASLVSGATVALNSTVQLLGTENPADGPAGGWEWTLVAPQGSTATFQPNADVQAPSVVPDVAGSYTVAVSAWSLAGLKSCVPGEATFLAE